MNSFGFLDGISNPAVAGVNKDLSGQGPVQPGVILLGRDGDPVTDRQGWTKDGSFLAFRFLQQLVPEFDRFLELNAPRVNDPAVNTAELLGARLTGRWKSGAPTQVTPLHDDPKLAADPTRNNVFTFDNGNQEKCPFAAHVRKMNPRGDIDQVNGINPHRVIRRGIQYGPEVNDRERKQHKTEKDRGLLFVSYQSSLENGFQFLQKRKWSLLLIVGQRVPSMLTSWTTQAGPMRPTSHRMHPRTNSPASTLSLDRSITRSTTKAKGQ